MRRKRLRVIVQRKSAPTAQRKRLNRETSTFNSHSRFACSSWWETPTQYSAMGGVKQTKSTIVVPREYSIARNEVRHTVENHSPNPARNEAYTSQAITNSGIPRGCKP